MISRNSEETTSQILLIGDDPNMLRTLRRNLVGRGYDVHIAFDDQECFAMATEINPDLCILILDFTTVNLDGLSVCEELRKRTSVPIIALSTTGSSRYEIQVLDTGADDYLVMPFGMEKFLARVRSALRRSSRFQAKREVEDRMIISGDLIIDAENRQVIVQGEEKAGGSRISLAARPTAQLVVDASALMALGAENMKPAQVSDPVAQFDVGAAAGHVGGDGHSAFLSGHGDDLRLCLVVLGIQYFMRDPSFFQRSRNLLRNID
jgi:DNA-binding response OmpR family regulator